MVSYFVSSVVTLEIISFSRYLKHKFQYRYMRSILVLYDYPLETVLNNILQNQLFIEEHERKMMTELFVE